MTASEGIAVATDDIIQFLSSSVPLFEGFPVDTLTTLAEGSQLTTFEPNEAVIEYGEEGRFIGVLMDGQAEVSVADDSGGRHQLAVLGPGDVFGEMAVMTGDRTVADVIGISRCSAVIIPQALFSTMLITHPPAIQRLAKLVSERARSGASERPDAGAARMQSDDPYGTGLTSEVPMKLLVVNCGSSSLKYTLYDTAEPDRTVKGTVERIGIDGTRLTSSMGADERVVDLPTGTHADAFAAMAGTLTDGDAAPLTSLSEISAVGHRVVHGGEDYPNSVVITDDTVAGIERLSSLAPLHNPVNLTGIREARTLLPDIPHVAVFDTSFHHTLPAYAYLYGLPYEAYENKGVRRYGFHGTSHKYVALKAAEFLSRPYNELEIVSCHLGNGASVCAVDHGRSVDTSMGLTPVEGLIMGTRSGDLDPGALLHLMRVDGLTVAQADTLINRESGLKGLSGISSDMREVEKGASGGDHRALLALKAFSYRVRKYIGAYAAAMGGIDVIVFTGGIGSGSPGVRSLACQGLGWMGIQLDEKANRAADGFTCVTDVSVENSPVRVLVVPTDEERMIAREVLRTLDREYITTILETQKNRPIPVEVSAHHVHLSQEHVEALFGTGHELTARADLSQPGQYACEEQVTLVGPKGRVERVRVLGPARSRTQVEIAMTEQFKLGIQPPIRQSGDLHDTPGVTLEGPAGSVVLEEGVICAMRHIHMTPADALQFGLRDGFIVRVRIAGDRELTFGDVIVRVSPTYRLAMHIDTDEGNAAHVRTGMEAFVDAIQSRN